MGLASIIISAATKEIAGFTVIGYLTEKAADIGTGKIWTELKKKIGDRPDSFECRLYGAIEKSVGEYLCKGTTEDVSAAICEYIFDAWCREGYLTPKRISNILHGYSSYAKQNDILAWYRTFQDQIIKDIDRNGNEGIGKPEPLTGNLTGFWSRRINDKDRLIYKIDDKNIYILSCRYHYNDK